MKFVIGKTGAGKTNTLQNILDKFKSEGRKFVIVDSIETLNKLNQPTKEVKMEDKKEVSNRPTFSQVFGKGMDVILSRKGYKELALALAVLGLLCVISENFIGVVAYIFGGMMIVTRIGDYAFKNESKSKNEEVKKDDKEA